MTETELRDKRDRLYAKRDFLLKTQGRDCAGLDKVNKEIVELDKRISGMYPKSSSLKKRSNF